MRWMRVAVAATITLTTVSAGASAVSAAGSETGARIDVSVSLTGFETPSAVWSNPCDGDEQYTRFVSHENPNPIYQDGTLEITNAQLSNELGRAYVESLYSQETVSRLVWSHTMWWSYCVDPDTLEIDGASQTMSWVPLVTQETVVSALYEHLWDYLAPPMLVWPSMDQEFGWLYVKTPNDFRIQQLSTISLTATVTNVTGTVTATVAASPSTLTIEPGEPGGSARSCPMAAALAPFSVASPGACSYTYQNASSIDPMGTFDVGSTVGWDIATSDPTFPIATAFTWSWREVSVAEAQAVVTG